MPDFVLANRDHLVAACFNDLLGGVSPTQNPAGGAGFCDSLMTARPPSYGPTTA
jgi:hypothetical protein